MINLLLSKYKLLAIGIAAVVIFTAGYKTSSHFSDEVIEDLTQAHEQYIAKIESENEQALKEKQDHINNLQQEFSIADDKYREAMNHVKIEIARRDADILAMRSVQHVKIKKPACRAEGNGKDSNSQSADETTLAELDPETAVRAFGITDEGDQAIIDLTALQEKVRSCANAGLCPFEFL